MVRLCWGIMQLYPNGCSASYLGHYGCCDSTPRMRAAIYCKPSILCSSRVILPPSGFFQYNQRLYVYGGVLWRCLSVRASETPRRRRVAIVVVGHVDDVYHIHVDSAYVDDRI